MPPCLALRFTGNRADAEELAQDTFLLSHGALSQISSPLHLRHWLPRTVSNRSLNMLRQRGRRPKLISLDTEVEVAGDPAAMPEADRLAASQLHGLLLQLPPDARGVMLLRLQEDLRTTLPIRAFVQCSKPPRAWIHGHSSGRSRNAAANRGSDRRLRNCLPAIRIR